MQGLTLTTAVPQTLGIGISLVRSMGGNEGLALFLTGGLAVFQTHSACFLFSVDQAACDEQHFQCHACTSLL